MTDGDRPRPGRRRDGDGDDDDAWTGDGDVPDVAELDPEVDRADDEADIEDLVAEFQELEDAVDTAEEREQVRETMRVAMAVKQRGVLGRAMSGFDRSDVAEATLGSLLFGIPMAVEGGTQEVGVYLAARPALLWGTFAAGVALVAGILYVADIQDVQIRNPILGVVPRKLVGVLLTSLVVDVALLTAWGRVDWADPGLAVAQVVVAFVPMGIGAALGDLLPG